MSLKCVYRVFLFSTIFLFLAAPAAYAQASLAVVDVDRLLSVSAAAQSVQKQVDEKRKTFLSEIEAEENKLREAQKKLESESKDLGKEELTKKVQAFEEKRLEARKLLQGRKASLDKAYGLAMKTLSTKIAEVVQDVANEKEYDLVITRQNVIVGSTSLDITDEVLARLDKALPRVDLKVE